MRVLLTWELGLNRGHVSRLLPIAQRLRLEGNVVLVAVRDLETAAAVLGPAGIPFIPAPHLARGIPLSYRPSGYADILLSQGWIDTSALWGLVHGWLNLFQLFKPDKLLLDYSPTVALASRIARIPTVSVGNGFELPPLLSPLPCFPGFSWATGKKAAESEKTAVRNAVAVLNAFSADQIDKLQDIFSESPIVLTTYPELDHYGSRDCGDYCGAICANLPGRKVAWPVASGPKVFASLRPDTAHLELLLECLAAMDARIICVANGLSKELLGKYKRLHIEFSESHVVLDDLLDADACITYGAEGTMMTFLLAGVPQIVAPWHVEAFMAARRIKAEGMGIIVDQDSTCDLGKSIEATILDESYRKACKSFAEKNRKPARTAIARAIDHLFGR